MKTTEKCTQCGQCCLASPCGISYVVLKNGYHCAALEKNNDKYECGLVLHPSQYVDLGTKMEWKDEFLGKLFASWLGIGEGCCSNK